MLSIGWTEMMLVAAIALIVVGPKDLPAMLRKIGSMVGSVRRMGNDFKNELNKVAAIDEIRDIKSSIAAPLTDTRKKIEEEFNSIAPDGSIVPSGKITPADPGAQSVVAEIRQGAGLDAVRAPNPDAVKASMAGSVTKAVEQNKQAAKVVAEQKLQADQAKTAKKPAAKKPGTKKAAVKKTAAKKPAARKPAAKKAPVTRKAVAAKQPVKSEVG